jgi:hypothetical protein
MRENKDSKYQKEAYIGLLLKRSRASDTETSSQLLKVTISNTVDGFGSRSVDLSHSGIAGLVRKAPEVIPQLLGSEGSLHLAKGP